MTTVDSKQTERVVHSAERQSVSGECPVEDSPPSKCSTEKGGGEIMIARNICTIVGLWCYLLGYLQVLH